MARWRARCAGRGIQAVRIDLRSLVARPSSADVDWHACDRAGRRGGIAAAALSARRRHRTAPAVVDDGTRLDGTESAEPGQRVVAVAPDSLVRGEQRGRSRMAAHACGDGWRLRLDVDAPLAGDLTGAIGRR